MRIAIAQIDPVVGDFEGNIRKISEAYKKACAADARLLLTPELGVCGYPPHDLLERVEIFERNAQAVEKLKKLTQGKSCSLIVGYVAPNEKDVGRQALNVAAVLEKGQEVFRQAKTLLPTYDVFDESRYFEPASERRLWDCDGVKVAISICEDLWAEDLHRGKRPYPINPVDDYKRLGVQLVLSVAASPYEWGKREHREKLHLGVAQRLRAPLVFVNQTGATDEILFDGASFVSDAKGSIVGRLPTFKTAFSVLDLDSGQWSTNELEAVAPDELESLYRGLVVGVREYFHRSGFKKAILGLSGGIDSSVVAVLAVQALGAKNVRGIAMPSQFSSSHSLTDAEALAVNLGIEYEVRPIKFTYASFSREIAEGRGILAPIALENLQARLRGVILMTLANHYGALTLTTGNKSEMALGYCTLYGDMVGALTPIGDLFKTRVYELARYMNQKLKTPIPEGSLTKPPSAELKPGQKDEDSLPPYVKLDPLLEDYLERLLPIDELIQKHGPQGPMGWVEKTLSAVECNEYKRLQSALVLKTSPKAFGLGRRFPVAKNWAY